jgi:hypothetical protein
MRKGGERVKRHTRANSPNFGPKEGESLSSIFIIIGGIKWKRF